MISAPPWGLDVSPVTAPSCAAVQGAWHIVVAHYPLGLAPCPSQRPEKSLSLSLSVSLLCVLLFHFRITSHLREEERTKICSSFLSKEGNDPPGLSPARLGQGPRLLPPLSQNPLPGQNSQPPNASVHCSPLAGMATLSTPCLKGDQVSSMSTATFVTEESETQIQEGLPAGTWHLYLEPAVLHPNPRNPLPPGPVAEDTGWEPWMLRSADPGASMAQRRHPWPSLRPA